jgi:3-hydroxymyristoyl/3-hydroxydecanoyl-(acyl carrier protein) dehydratase
MISMIDLDVELANQFIINKISEKDFEMTVHFPGSLSYFSGHFPTFPVLPAVALIDISTFFIHKIQLDTKTTPQNSLAKIDQLKIKNPIGPDEKVQVRIMPGENKSFEVKWSSALRGICAELNLTFC